MNIETKQWSNILDRSRWGSGPWDGEPDKMQWRDEETGLACLAHRGGCGNWCGYVGLPPGHPWRTLGYDDMPAEVHGGLTFGPEACRGGICHETDGEDDVMWIGFDCAHCGDLVPASRRVGLTLRAIVEPDADGETYRTLPWVRDEVARLAAQVHAVPR